MSPTFVADNMDITLIRADATDLPVLAEINRLAYLPETIAQFAFTNWPDEANMLDFFTARVKDRLHDPDTQVFKAVEAATGRIAGFMCWTLEPENEGKPGSGVPVPTPTSNAAQQMPAGLNMEFIMTTGAEIETLRNHMKGTTHYCESSYKRASPRIADSC